MSDIPTITIELSGNSIPEDANYFYFPLLEVMEVLEKTNLQFTFNFKFHHYNTISTRYVTTLLNLFKAGAAKKRITLNWYYISADGDYRNFDEDLKELGEDYQQTLKLKMNILPRKL